MKQFDLFRENANSCLQLAEKAPGQDLLDDLANGAGIVDRQCSDRDRKALIFFDDLIDFAPPEGLEQKFIGSQLSCKLDELFGP